MSTTSKIVEHYIDYSDRKKVYSDKVFRLETFKKIIKNNLDCSERRRDFKSQLRYMRRFYKSKTQLELMNILNANKHFSIIKN